MGKRRHKDHNVDAICRKIRRLERRLRRGSRRSEGRGGSVTPSSHTMSDRQVSEERSISDMEYLEEDYPRPNLESVVRVVTPQVPITMATSFSGPSTSSAAVPVQIPARVPVQVPVQDPIQAQVTVPDQISIPVVDQTLSTPLSESNLSSSVVPDEILEMLGEAKTIEETLGEAIPKEISERWGKILLDGLAKEQKESLIEKMPIPENFILARAPKLNPEVNSVLSDATKNRDKRLEKAQNQLGAGIAGLVNLTKDLIKSDINKLDIIKRLSEISQILLDLHFEETINRRKLVIPLLDKSFWSTIQGVKRETFLFGDKLGENIKNSKDIEKTGQQIKKPATTRTNFQRKALVSGNLRFPPRQQNNPRSAAAAPRQNYEPQPSTSTRRNTSTSHPPRINRPPANKSRDRRRR